jgi:trimeric autotransporter adhesin
LYVTATVPASSLGTSSSTGSIPVLLTYSTFTTWNVTQTDEPYSDLAVTVPAVGAYFAGPQFTEGRSYCSATSLTASTSQQTTQSTTNTFSPIADSEQITTDRIIATTDGHHILGATASGSPRLYDLTVTLPPATQETNNPLICTTSLGNPTFSSSVASHNLTGTTAASITGIIPASNSASAFVTYTGAGSVLPLYQPNSGTLTNIPLSGTATAPVAGVFSSDDTTFYAGTSGDNQVHVISVNGASTKDSGVITPNLPDPNGGIATPNLIAQRVRRTTS